MKVSAKKASCTAITRSAMYARVNLHKKTGTTVSKSHCNRTSEKSDKTEHSVGKKKQSRPRKQIVNKRTIAVQKTMVTNIKVLSAQELPDLQGGLAGMQVGAVEQEFPSRDA